MKRYRKWEIIILLFIIHTSAWNDVINGQKREELKGWMLGVQLEEIYYQGDEDTFNELFDKEYIYDQILEKSEDGFIVEFNEEVKSEGVTQGLWDELMTQIQNGSYYNFVSHRTYNDRIEVLFRLFSESGLNYHNYIFHEVDGEYLIRDIYLFITGEYFTETLSTAFRDILASVYGEIVDEEMDLATLAKLKEANVLLNEGKNQEAMTLLEKGIDQKYQDRRRVLIYRLRATDDVNSDEYINLVQQLDSMTDVRSTIFLLGIDRYVISEQYSDAMRMIDSLELMTQDAILDYYRGNIYLAQGKVDEAVRSYMRLKDNFPYLPESYDNLIDLYYHLMEYENAFGLLKEAHKNIQISKKDLDIIISQEYPMLSSQSYYKEWLRSSTSIFENMATSITESLAHIWELNKIIDPDGHSMKVPPGVDQWTFNADYSCIIKHEDEEKYGLWEYDLTTDELFIYIPIDEKTIKGKNMIDKGDFFENDAGDKFSQRPMEIAVLYGSTMSVKDDKGNLFSFSKDVPTTSREKFEGKVVYENDVTDKTGVYSSEEIENVVGAYYTYYVKGNKNRSEASGIFKGIKLYTGGDTLFSFEPNVDTVYYELIAEKQNEVIEWEIVDEGPEFLGFNTKRFIYQTINGSYEIYFSDHLQVDGPLEETSSGSWNFFFNKTASIKLKSYTDDQETTNEALASKVIAMQLPDSLFEVPGGVRVPLKE